jgi:hypothetical protein
MLQRPVCVEGDPNASILRPGHRTVQGSDEKTRTGRIVREWRAKRLGHLGLLDRHGGLDLVVRDSAATLALRILRLSGIGG